MHICVWTVKRKKIALQVIWPHKKITVFHFRVNIFKINKNLDIF